MGKYEEALERARAGKPIDEVFPELKESEDERIRKWMINEIKIFYDFESPSLNPMVEKALAYLEKQQERKPTEWSEEDEKMLTNMNRYIEVEKLKAEIERRNLSNRYITTEGYEQELYEIIAYLQQEQPEGGCSEKPNDLLSGQEPTCKDYTHFADVGKMEQPEADLELEIERIVKDEEKFMKFQVRHQLIGYVARHFYEFGLNARKEESK